MLARAARHSPLGEALILKTEPFQLEATLPRVFSILHTTCRAVGLIVQYTDCYFSKEDYRDTPSKVCMLSPRKKNT